MMAEACDKEQKCPLCCASCSFRDRKCDRCGVSQKELMYHAHNPYEFWKMATKYVKECDECNRFSALQKSCCVYCNRKFTISKKDKKKKLVRKIII